jgi:hypothetical protein
VAAALVLALAFGSWFTRPTDTGPVASSASPTTPSASTQGPASTSDSGTPVRVFFVRDVLPPLSANASAHGPAPTTAEQRVLQRIGAAHDAGAGTVPAGAANPLALVGRVQTPTGGSASYGVGVSISGDTAKVEFILANGWQIHGTAQAQALIQQIVYVVTEEPGIRKALITEQGRTNAVIDGLIVDRPLAREDVTGYGRSGSLQPAHGLGERGGPQRVAHASHSVDAVAPGLTRFVVQIDPPAGQPTRTYPDWNVNVSSNPETFSPDGGKWQLTLEIFDAVDAAQGVVLDGRAPLRSITTGVGFSGTPLVYVLALDDLRPWRTAIAYNPFRIIVDIGGDPRAIFGDTNAVYAPSYGAAVGRAFQVSGIAHNGEANVVIRVLDDKQKEIYRGSTTATNCCDPGGTFDGTVQLPTNATGNIFLEVLETSAKDGSNLKLIRIPLTVR